MSSFEGWLLGRSGSPDEPDAELGPFPCVPRPLGPGCGSSKILVLLSLMKKEFLVTCKYVLQRYYSLVDCLKCGKKG